MHIQFELQGRLTDSGRDHLPCQPTTSGTDYMHLHMTKNVFDTGTMH